MSYTKGEWTVGEFKNTGTNPNSESGHFPINSPRWDAFIICYRHEMNEDRQEAEANAKLIAAAPDLLEVLTELQNQFNDPSVAMHTPIAYFKAFDKAEEAIKKATA